MNYEALIFEGGGMKGLCYVGALLELSKDNFIDLSTIHHYGGTSAGSIIATLLACNYTLEEIEDVMFHTKWKKAMDGNFGIFRNMYRLFRKFGYHKGLFIKKLINKLLLKKTGIKNITFEQMYNITNNHLKVVGTNVTKGKVVYMDHINTPHMPVAKGVQISSCVPFIFEPVTYKNEVYIDGGLIRNLDLDMFREYGLFTLAFDLVDNHFIDDNISNMVTYFQKVFKIIHKEANKYHISQLEHVLQIYENVISPFNFDISKKNLEHLKNVGVSYAKNFKLSMNEYFENKL